MVVYQEFDVHCANGLPPESGMMRSAPYMKTCSGLRPTKWGGLQNHRHNAASQTLPDAAITSLGLELAYPFPHLCQILGDPGQNFFLYGINASSPDKPLLISVAADGSSAATISTKNWTEFVAGGTPSAKDIELGADLSTVDFQGFYMLMNGISTIFKTGASNDWFVQDAVTISCGCEHNKGRVLLAGFDPTDCYALADWPTYLSGKNVDLPADILALADSGMDENWVWWSSIGGGDSLMLFDLNSMIYGTFDAARDRSYTEEDPYWQELWMRNQMGAMPMPWIGAVEMLLPMGPGRVVVYGAGVSCMLAVSSPISTYGLQGQPSKLGGIGMASSEVSRTCAAGYEDIHVMIGNDDNLWALTPSQTGIQAQRLGFESQIADLTNPRIDYLASDEQFVISSATKAFVLDRDFKLSESHHPVSGFLGAKNITAKTYPTGANKKLRFGKSVADKESGRIMNLAAIRVRGLNPSQWTLRVYYRTSPSTGFEVTEDISLDTRGYRALNIPVFEYEVELEIMSGSQTATCEGISVTLNDANTKLGHISGGPRPAIGAE